MKQIVVKNPHNFVIQFILLQIPFREFCANLRFLFFRKSVQPPMIHALDRVNALEKSVHLAAFHQLMSLRKLPGVMSVICRSTLKK